jgi:ABC-type polysaccharide/polyol phosphate transport system ATPase subunit
MAPATVTAVPSGNREPFAVSVDGVSKRFELPHQHVQTLKERALHPFRRTTYERLDALDDVSFEVAPGEFFGIVGRNGSGKSTLLKCLAGIYRADRGHIWVAGRMATFIELGVGFNFELTARDNVLINAIMLGLTPAEARARYERVIEFAELERFVDLRLKNYSSGMQVRLAFAVMVQVDADLLLIDEVLAVGDAAFQQKCHDTLRGLHDDGRTILLVTHDMNAVERFCDRGLVLERGKIVDIGTPHAIARRYNELNFAYGGRDAAPAAPAAQGGDGAATIHEAWTEDADGRRTDVLEQGGACTVKVTVEFAQPAAEPILGVALSDDRGRRVFATSTAWNGVRTGTFAPGERAELAVRFEVVLAPGRYFVSPFVAHAGSGERYMDLREQQASLVVTGSRLTGGTVDLPHDLAISRARERGAVEAR